MISGKCKWCGADLWDYGDTGPLHAKDGRSVNACELIQLRALCDRLVTNDSHFAPDWDVDGLAADALREHEAIVARSKELQSRRNT